MKRKIATTMILLGILFTLGIGLASAQDEVELFAYTDKAYYEYGEEGVLFVTVWNKIGAIDLISIKVNLPWKGLYHETWSGNLTKEINAALGKGEMATYKLAFKVPSESRDRWKNNKATVILNYEIAGERTTKEIDIQINVAIPVYNENLAPIYYMTGGLATLLIIVIIELYFVWRRLGKLTAPSEAP